MSNNFKETVMQSHFSTNLDKLRPECVTFGTIKLLICIMTRRQDKSVGYQAGTAITDLDASMLG